MLTILSSQNLIHKKIPSTVYPESRPPPVCLTQMTLQCFRLTFMTQKCSNYFRLLPQMSLQKSDKNFPLNEMSNICFMGRWDSNTHFTTTMGHKKTHLHHVTYPKGKLTLNESYCVWCKNITMPSKIIQFFPFFKSHYVLVQMINNFSEFTLL